MNMLHQFLNELPTYLRPPLEIGILTFLLYLALLFVRGTRAVTVMAGFVTVILTLSFLSQTLELEVIGWIVAKMWPVLTIAVFIIFQPEIRRAFAEIGSRQSRFRLHGDSTRQDMELISALLDSTFYLADRRIGALIAIEQSIGMRAFAETGTRINAPVTSKLISTIFFPNTPLHDGGVIISGHRIAAAGCIFPLTQSTELSKSLGTRHRAGVGLTEETDAVVIVVSEESGSVSLARRGRLTRGVDRQRLRRHLTNYLVKQKISRRRQRELSRSAENNSALATANSTRDKGMLDL
jgi:diadenylate cyclase